VFGVTRFSTCVGGQPDQGKWLQCSSALEVYPGGVQDKATLVPRAANQGPALRSMLRFSAGVPATLKNAMGAFKASTCLDAGYHRVRDPTGRAAATRARDEGESHKPERSLMLLLGLDSLDNGDGQGVTDFPSYTIYTSQRQFDEGNACQVWTSS
jgi:hypothetical protein